MTRDFDLIRKLLVFFDQKDDFGVVEGAPSVGPEYTEDQIQYHLQLLCQAGFLDYEAERSSTSDRIIRVYPFNLTWEGHEFLAKIRNDGVWQRLKAAAISKGGTLSFTLLNQLATRLLIKAATEVNL